MSQRITLTSNDDHSIGAWRSDPKAAAKGGIVMLHAVYGLTDHMGDVCDAFGAQGYAAIAPALYDRIGPGIVHPYTAEGVAAGRGSYGALSKEQILADVGAAGAALRDAGPVAVSGFCTGGTWAWIAAAELDFDAAVIFYGSQVPAHLHRTPKCPTILHYGDNDRIVPMADVEKIRAAHPALTHHVYPGGQHAFFNPAQDAFDAGIADLAFRRSIDFLARHPCGPAA
jgi:carboxymethylenebutenolidase